MGLASPDAGLTFPSSAEETRHGPDLDDCRPDPGQPDGPASGAASG